MMFRSRRLEELLGARLGTVTYADLAGLMDNTEAAEDEELDYKREITAKDEAGKEEFAKDLVAFANHRGGLLLVGMTETQGIPRKVTDADLSDGHMRHLQQVASRWTSPPVPFDMRAVHNPESPGRGFLLIAVPRTGQHPHAITIPPVKASEHTLRYPRRSGSKTIWMTETDVATAYYDRLRAAAARDQRRDEVEAELLAALPASNIARLIVTLVPEAPGTMEITQDSYERHKHTLLNTSLPGQGSRVFHDVRIGARRLIPLSNSQVTQQYYGHLHRDGAGSFAGQPPRNHRTQNNEEFDFSDPGAIVHLLLGALHLLGQHARDRCGATGTALVKACLVEAPHQHPHGPARPQLYPMPRYRLDRIDHTGCFLELSTQTSAYAHAEAAVLLDDLADGGTGLAQATSALAGELFQAFGIAECTQITHDGTVQLAQWPASFREPMSRWAEMHQVPCTGP